MHLIFYDAKVKMRCIKTTVFLIKTIIFEKVSIFLHFLLDI